MYCINLEILNDVFVTIGGFAIGWVIANMIKYLFFKK